MSPRRVSNLDSDLSEKTKTLEQRLAQFSYLPPETGVNILFVSVLTGRSAASIWRDVNSGRLPKPLKYGPRSTRWRVGDLRAHFAQMASAV
jgi:predicted DNA-binding transcriptional regulator AlpA